MLVLASWWAAVASGGRSSFTPVAIGFACSLVARCGHAGAGATALTMRMPEHPGSPDSSTSALMGGSVVVIARARAASARSTRPRGRATASSLSSSMTRLTTQSSARTSRGQGHETAYSPSGFTDPGLPSRPGTTGGNCGSVGGHHGLRHLPVAARHFVVLPLLLLAAATLTGTLVRQITGATARSAFFFGFLACLVPGAGPFHPRPAARGALRRFDLWDHRVWSRSCGGAFCAVQPDRVRSPNITPWSVIVFIGTAAAVTVPAFISSWLF